MNEEQMCRLLEVLETRKIIKGYDSEYIQEKLFPSEWNYLLKKEGKDDE